MKWVVHGDWCIDDNGNVVQRGIWWWLGKINNFEKKKNNNGILWIIQTFEVNMINKKSKKFMD